jgi:hypothetical protein
MKKLISLLALTLFISVIYAQRVNLDRFNFTVSYRDFPENPLPEAYKTYNVRLEAPPSLGLGYSAANVAGNIGIEGLRKVDGTGHITILLMLDDLVFEKPETIETVKTSKDKEGHEIKTSLFSTKIAYSFAARMSVYDYKGNTLVDNQVLFDRNNKRYYQTPENKSAEEATTYFNNKLGETRLNLVNQMVLGITSQANNWLNVQYGYPERRVSDILWILNNRRQKSYSDHQRAWNQFKDAIALENANEPLDNVKKKMQPVIDYFEKAKKQYVTSSKEDRKMRYASYYNLAKIFLYLDEPEKAMTEADALAMNDFDERDGRNLQQAALALQNKLKKNNANSRHFAINVSSYPSPLE